MKWTDENFKQYAVKPLARWLISAAYQRSFTTYGEVKTRLVQEIGFNPSKSARLMGRLAGIMMNHILEDDLETPLLNILLVGQDTLLPGDGAKGFLNRRFNKRCLHVKHRDWNKYCNKAETEVYTFPHWKKVYKKVFDETFMPEDWVDAGKERDGISSGQSGEGRNHRNLRLWVKNNPGKIDNKSDGARTETEVVLKSGDRVDVVIYGSDKTIAVEVKSRDSNETDLERGIYQCIKYRAVMAAMDIRDNPYIIPVLVTENALPGNLNNLAKLHGITLVKAPLKRK